MDGGDGQSRAMEGVSGTVGMYTFLDMWAKGADVLCFRLKPFDPTRMPTDEQHANLRVASDRCERVACAISGNPPLTANRRQGVRLPWAAACLFRCGAQLARLHLRRWVESSR